MRLCYIWWQVQDKRVNTCFYLPPWNRASTVTFALRLFDAVFSDLMMAVTGLGARGFHIQRNTEEKALSRRANWNTPWSVPGEGLRVREGRGGGGRGGSRTEWRPYNNYRRWAGHALQGWLADCLISETPTGGIWAVALFADDCIIYGWNWIQKRTINGQMRPASTDCSLVHKCTAEWEVSTVERGECWSV